MTPWIVTPHKGLKVTWYDVGPVGAPPVVTCERLEDANLIAASPILLAACKHWREMMQAFKVIVDEQHSHALTTAARLMDHAIGKAEGKP